MGFDDGSDLGMKGSDSAMPIWAEFMREALRLHPEWNGDWEMPATIQKAEIDIRDGSVLRELTDTQAESVKAQQKVLDKTKAENITAETEVPDAKEIYVSNIPPEFRRVELFISGTVPNRTLLPVKEADADVEDLSKPKPTPTPFTTWENAEKDPKQEKADRNNGLGSVDKITMMWCPVSQKRANANCPTSIAKVFLRGNEPEEFCTFHLGPPK